MAKKEKQSTEGEASIFIGLSTDYGEQKFSVGLKTSFLEGENEEKALERVWLRCMAFLDNKADETLNLLAKPTQKRRSRK